MSAVGLLAWFDRRNQRGTDRQMAKGRKLQEEMSRLDRTVRSPVDGLLRIVAVPGGQAEEAVGGFLGIFEWVGPILVHVIGERDRARGTIVSVRTVGAPAERPVYEERHLHARDIPRRIDRIAEHLSTGALVDLALPAERGVELVTMPPGWRGRME